MGCFESVDELTSFRNEMKCFEFNSQKIIDNNFMNFHRAAFFTITMYNARIAYCVTDNRRLNESLAKTLLRQNRNHV